MPPLIKARTKTTAKGDVGFLALKKELRKAQGSYVTVGILEPERRYPLPVTRPKKGGGKASGSAPIGATLGQVAVWMEFGTHDRQGNPIVPARSFIRSPIDRGLAAIERVKTKALQQLALGEITLQVALGRLGAECQRRMQNAIVKSETGPPLKPKTLARKRKLGQPDIPLIATGLLRSSIAFAVTLAGGGGKTKK